MLHKEKDRLDNLIQQLLLDTTGNQQQFHEIRKGIESLAESTQDIRAIGYSKMLMITEYLYTDGNLQIAREEIMNVIECGVKSGDILLEAYGYWHSGNCYDIQGETLVAFDQYWLGVRKTKSFTRDNRIKENLLRRFHLDIAVCLMSGGEYEQALYYLNNLEIEKMKLIHIIINISNKVICYYKLNRFDEAQKEMLNWEQKSEGVDDKKGCLYFPMITWKYILLNTKGEYDVADALMQQILTFNYNTTEAETLSYLCEYLLETKQYNYLNEIFVKEEEHIEKLNSKRKMLDLIKLKIRYLEDIHDVDSYQKGCILLYQLQQEVDEQEKEQKKSSLAKFIAVMQKEEEQEALIKMREILKHKSEYDEMTELPNRYKLNDFCKTAFAEAVKNGSKISVEILDVDFFKQFNDNYGHPAGDKCLIMIAEQVKKNIEDSDLGARYGGDEFVIIRINKTDEEIKQSMEHLRQSILDCATPHKFSKAASVVTISQGAMNEIPKECDNWKEFLKRADEALFEAKKISKNTVVMA